MGRGPDDAGVPDDEVHDLDRERADDRFARILEQLEW